MDIFAFGSVLYEMATARRAFEGKSQVSLMAAILEQHPPPVSTLQSLSPKRFDDVVRICLAKHPDERWQSAADIIHELRLIGQDKTVAAPSPKRIGKRERIVWAGALSAVIVASVVLFWITSQREVPAKVSFDVTANSIGAMDRLRVRRERNISGVRARLPGSPREVASLQPEIGVSALESQRQRALLRRIGMVGGGRCDHVGESIPGRNTRVLFNALRALGVHNFDVSPDGQRFMVITEGLETRSAPVTVVLNWLSGTAR